MPRRSMPSDTSRGPGPMYLYRYVIDNRIGPVDISEISILVNSVQQNFSLIPCSHTEPTGWVFSVAESGGSANPPLDEFGTFWAWNNEPDALAGTMLPIFSFITDRARTLVDRNNFFLHRPALGNGHSDDIAAFGFTLAHDFGV